MIKILIKTEMGDITAEVYDEKAPRTSAHFMSYAGGGYYDGASFYRVCGDTNQPFSGARIKIIEAGYSNDYYDSVLTNCFADGFDDSRGHIGAKPCVMVETTSETGLRHEDMTISMGRTARDRVDDSFFICVGDQPSLDEGGTRHPDGLGFSAFGKVTEGRDVVLAITGLPAKGQKLIHGVKILKVLRL